MTLLLDYNDTIVVEIAEVILDMSAVKSFLETLELDQRTEHERLALELVDLALEWLGFTNFFVVLVVVSELFHTRIWLMISQKKEREADN